MHPSEETLLAVASGHADLPHRVLVEGHLDSCAACRSTVGEISAPGGALLAGLPAESPPAALWEQLLARLDVPEPATPGLAGIPLPAGARRELPPLGKVRWRWVPAPGARVAALLRDPTTGSVLYLGHMAPRRFFPRHVHLGPEDILVLAGGFQDQYGCFEAGAYASYSPGTQHRPLTEPDEECWTLTRLEKPNLFTGWRGWFQRLFFL